MVAHHFLTNIISVASLFEKVAQQTMLPGMEKERPITRDPLEFGTTKLDIELKKPVPYGYQTEQLLPFPKEEGERWQAREPIFHTLPTPTAFPPIDESMIKFYEGKVVEEKQYGYTQKIPKWETVKKELTEEDKQIIKRWIDKYNHFRNYYITFYRAYHEARDMMETDIPSSIWLS